MILIEEIVVVFPARPPPLPEKEGRLAFLITAVCTLTELSDTCEESYFNANGYGRHRDERVNMAKYLMMSQITKYNQLF